MGLYTIEGTWDEIKRHEPEFAGRRLRVTVEEDIPVRQQGKAPSGPKQRRVSAMGKYAGVLSSEEFIRRKQEDMELEDRPIQ
jgi:hypothetical protein